MTWLPVRLLPVVFKQVWRHRMRSLLTVLGVALAMFLFVTVQTLHGSVRRATTAAAEDTKLIVYRENRFCPATSRLPEHYQSRIAKISGVTSVVPMKIVVNNCRASLDVVTFRGVPEGELEHLQTLGKWRVVSGEISGWRTRGDAAIVGKRLAERRRLRVGESFDAAGITVTVAAIIDSNASQDQNVAYVQLPFLQQSSGGGTRASSDGGLGVVTQFSVEVADPAMSEAVARAIDDEFRSDPEPTTTRAERAFVAQAGSDVVRLVGFVRWLGLGCLAAVLGLIGNAVVLSVQDRVRDHAVLQTLGYRPGLIGRMIVAEGVILSLTGGVAGMAAAAVVLRLGSFTLSSEGLSILVELNWNALAVGFLSVVVVGVLAGLVPAWQAGRRDLPSCFRAV